MSECPYKDAWFLPCQFEPRYDIGPVDMSGMANATSIKARDPDIFRRKTYVHDICVRCGVIVKRDPK